MLLTSTIVTLVPIGQNKSLWRKRKTTRKGYRITGTHFLTIIAIAALVFAMWWGGVFSSLSGVPQPDRQTGNLVDVNKPIQFSVMDPIGGSAVTSATVYVYDGLQLVDTLTTTSAGIANTTKPFASGKSLNVKIVESSYVTKWQTVTVPQMNDADKTQDYNYISLDTRNIGTYTTIRVFNENSGSSVSDGGAINITDYSSTPLKLTVTIANSEDNSGYISSYDPLNKINLNAVMVTSSTTSYMTVQNAGTYAPRGTVSYWLQTCNDELITKHLVGGTYVKPGQQAFSFNVYKGSLTSAANQTINIDLYKYFDTSYFATQGIGGPDAATMATQFNIEFYTA